MGTSISTTKTHERLQQQREQRKQGRQGKKNELHGGYMVPFNERIPTNNQANCLKQVKFLKVNQQQTQRVQKYSINLKSVQFTTNQHGNTIQTENIKNSMRKQLIRESSYSENNQMTIKNNQPQTEINSHPSIQEINFNGKENSRVLLDHQKLPSLKGHFSSIYDSQKTQIHLKPSQSVRSINKPQGIVLIHQEKAQYATKQPYSTSGQVYSQFADKQLAERKRKQAMKYIKESDFLSPNKKPLNNSPYKLGNSPRRVEEFVASNSLAVDLMPKSPQLQAQQGGRIKLKTEEEAMQDYQGKSRQNSSSNLSKKATIARSLLAVNKKY